MRNIAEAGAGRGGMRKIEESGGRNEEYRRSRGQTKNHEVDVKSRGQEIKACRR